MALSNLARQPHPLARLKAIHALREEIEALLEYAEDEALLAARSMRDVTVEDMGRARHRLIECHAADSAHREGTAGGG